MNNGLELYSFEEQGQYKKFYPKEQVDKLINLLQDENKSLRELQKGTLFEIIDQRIEELKNENAELRDKINKLESTYETVYVLNESYWIDSVEHTSVLSYGFTEENKAKEEVDTLYKNNKDNEYSYYEINIRR